MNAPGGKKHPILNCTRRKNPREEKRETRRSLQHPERKASGDLSTYFSGRRRRRRRLEVLTLTETEGLSVTLTCKQ